MSDRDNRGGVLVRARVRADAERLAVAIGDALVLETPDADYRYRVRMPAAAWAEFVGYVSDYTLRGPLRAALTTNDLGWLAANIDIGQPPTPYRFFYIWLHETDTWRIVISHDAVSRPLTSDLGG